MDGAASASTINLFGVPLDLIQPDRLLASSAWTGHIPFAFWLVAALRPRVIVELGTHTGASYCAMCEAVQRYNLNTACFAVDTWQGDEHAGFYNDSVYEDLRQYNDSRYGSFSTLFRSTFDDAVDRFGAGGVDLLHIDGLHTYEAVRHDFEAWKSRLSNRAVVLLHDTTVREGSFGVWQFWEQIQEDYPSFSFLHSCGLGVLGVGSCQPKPVEQLLEANSVPKEAVEIRRLFAVLGEGLQRRLVIEESTAKIERQSRLLAERDENIAVLQAELANSTEVAKASLEARCKAEQELMTVLESCSWRLTGPARKASRLLHAIARRGYSALGRIRLDPSGR